MGQTSILMYLGKIVCVKNDYDSYTTGIRSKYWKKKNDSSFGNSF